MGEYLIKPYEISVWEDKLTQNGFEEIKLAVIGSNTMIGLNKIYEPIFTKKNNGEKVLTFSLKYKYFDPYNENSEIVNPFAALLINERKIKLHYENKWYEFIIKEHTESSDGLIWTYTCVDAFVLELSKTGYNITFSADLNNNQGTAIELATETLKNTDWMIASDSDAGKQQINEAIYKGRIYSKANTDFIVVNGEGSVPAAGTDIYIFYSYVANKDGKFVQFIARNDSGSYTIDDNNTIIATNYRVTTELYYDTKIVNNISYTGFWNDQQLILQVYEDQLETHYHAYRLVYNQLTTYDPVMQRTVKRYKLKSNLNQEIYSFIDSEQVSSVVLTNFITNSDNFNIYSNGTLQGWNNYIKTHNNEWLDMSLTTKPPVSNLDPLIPLSSINQIEGFLKVGFHRWGDVRANKNTYDCIFNSGIADNVSILDNIAVNDKFVFRYRAYFTNVNGSVDNENSHLRLFVAKYKEDETWQEHTVKNIDTGSIVLATRDLASDELNNIIADGTFSNDFKHYYIDGVEQVPSTKYIYKNKNSNEEYIWDINHQTNNQTDPKFVLRTANNYVPYRYAIATAQRAVSKQELQDPKEHYGIFIYYWSNGSYLTPKICYIQDIQLTRYIPDNNGKPLTIGNIPDATPKNKEYFYDKPKEGQLPEETVLFTDYSDKVIPIYNENSVKTSSIEVSHSNCFNTLQTIAETFQCWIDLEVQHDDYGRIIYDNQNIPQKFVHLREYVGHDNWAGFKYGININTIERNVNSEEIVTKLLVTETQSDYTDTGSVAIAYANDNPNGENFILNFDYFSKQGLIDGDIRGEIDRFNQELKQYNDIIKLKSKIRDEWENSLNKVNDYRNVYTSAIDEASRKQNEALDRFFNLTGETYDSYQAQHETIDINEKLTNEDTLGNIIGEIYSNSAVKNSYQGILTNLNVKYKELKRNLKGDQTYYIELSVLEDTNYGRHVVVSVNDYDAPFQFVLDGNTYAVDISNKYFSIPSNAQTITFTCTTPQTYQASWTNNVITIDDNTVLKFELTPKGEIQVGIEDEIQTLIEEKENIKNTFEKKYKRFIQEGTWSATDYIDSNLYYLDALQVSNTSANPNISYTINVVEISEIEGYEYYNFDVGDKTYIEDTEFFGWHTDNVGTTNEPIWVNTPAREEVIVSEVEWHLDDPQNNNIVVQNYKTRFEDLFQRISATVQTVQYNEATYAKINTLLDANGTINQNVLIASMNRIAGKEYPLTSDGSIQIHGDEILIHNLTNSSNYVMINNEGIKISSDGKQTWATAITGRGIDIGTVYTGMLNTDLIIIGNKNNPSFRWDKSGISAYRFADASLQPTRNLLRANSEDSQAYDLQTFVRYDQYGLYGIKNNESFKASSIEDIKQKAHFAVTWDGFFIKNSYPQGGRVEITSDNDFRITKETNNQIDEKIKIGALEWKQADWETGDPIYTDPTTVPDAIKALGPSLYGIRIKNNAGQIVMKTGDDGNLEITGTIYAHAGEIGGMVVNNDQLSMNHIILKPGVGIYSDYSTPTPFIISDTDGSATFNQIMARGHIEAQTGTLGLLTVQDTITVGDETHGGTIQSNGYVTGSTGWAIKSNGTAEFQNATVRGHIDATSGTLNNLDITGGITVVQNGYIKSNNYSVGNQTGWQITDNSAIFNNVTARGHIEASTGTLGALSVIDTITVGDYGHAGLIKSYNYVSGSSGWAINSAGNAEFYNAVVRGEVNAGSGNFYGNVTIGRENEQDPDYILIDGNQSQIRSANYSVGGGTGWMINNDGDAYFMNITARGAIKTAVFEYAEIQAVGGIFLFRPSSTIKSARFGNPEMGESNNDLIVTVEKPILFAKVSYDKILEPTGNPSAQDWYEKTNYGYQKTSDTSVIEDKNYYSQNKIINGSWCKISNYIANGVAEDSTIQNILLTNGLTHVYKVVDVNLSTREVTLYGAAAMVEGPNQVTTLKDLEGGALVDMGREDGSTNYGIGVNSSDNTVNLPARAISLFETEIKPNAANNIKVSYKYKGILGTLPALSENEVNGAIYNDRMAGTQGIYTDNMYLGDKDQYIAFYEDEHGDKQLRIKANQIVYEITDEQGHPTGEWKDVQEAAQGADGEDAITVRIDSSAGTVFLNKQITTTLTCTVTKGNGTDITNQVTRFTWSKKNADGTVDTSWSRPLAGNTITISEADVTSKAIFTCEVEF